MKVIAFNGSPRVRGNTFEMLKAALSELAEKGIETELINIGTKIISGCKACDTCKEKKDEKCAIQDDINNWIQKIKKADGIILGSPVYFSDVTAEMKAFIDRVGRVTLTNNRMMKGKVAGSAVAVRRGGAIHTFDTLNHFFLISEMIVTGSNYWNMGIGREEKEVLKDKEGIGTMKTLGQNMASLLMKIKT